ncbi:hypothetical protein EIP86_004570 [Pleurotus ostreatoroseus]|nr:hypothetical protein EIP86_004570 [Pleurotus ostreatoroseus]
MMSGKLTSAVVEDTHNIVVDATFKLRGLGGFLSDDATVLPLDDPTIHPLGRLQPGFYVTASVGSSHTIGLGPNYNVVGGVRVESPSCDDPTTEYTDPDSDFEDGMPEDEDENMSDDDPGSEASQDEGEPAAKKTRIKQGTLYDAEDSEDVEDAEDAGDTGGVDDAETAEDAEDAVDAEEVDETVEGDNSPEVKSEDQERIPLNDSKRTKSSNFGAQGHSNNLTNIRPIVQLGWSAKSYLRHKLFQA